MLLQILRIYLTSAENEKNWLTAISHPKLSHVIGAKHVDFCKAWTLEELAEVAGMSRSVVSATNHKARLVLPLRGSSRFGPVPTNAGFASLMNAEIKLKYKESDKFI